MSQSPILLSSPSNFAVVQLPHRKYPGVVVQGDTLNSLVKNLELMEKLAITKNSDELIEEVREMRDLLSSALKLYINVCNNKNIEIPF